MSAEASAEGWRREAEGRSSFWGLETIMVPLTSVRSLVDGVTSLASAYYHAGEDKVTITRNVTASDTLTSIAARFDTTPSELTKLNKLLTRFVYPGQVIAVPDKATVTLDDKPGIQDPPDDTGGGHDSLTHIRPPSPNHRVDLRSPASPHTCPRTPANSMETEKSLDKECLEKFLKISVRHITDGQGVVAGVLLVTPNAVMFDPNVSDPLVIEHGPESYGVIAPMEFVVNAALYYDIAHMRVKDTNLPKPEIPKPEIYWGPAGQVERMGSQESPGKDASLSKDTTFPELAASQDDNDSSCSCGGDTRETSAFPKAFEQELLSPIGSDTSPANGEGQPLSGQPSPAQQPPVVGDLTPIAEATQASGPILAQTVCDNKAAQDLAQSDTPAPNISDDPLTNEKKRTTSVTFDLSGEGEEASPDTTSENNLQETRKQKVLKRLSYPLSWMESFSTEKENMPHPAGVQPSSAPPVGPHPPTEGPEGAKPGVFSNVFSMSNVSSMLSR
ncbi:Nuclear receptor coactivator 7 [Portunus trituberculatus]|uniref:Nuclear receptor coactivator 7 n=1 Tax=Portunus trituberculatus TaxID=210409 RepID=A0A5B7DFQ0_PORTR|nr:Nuclear receptor coactivator 7 [Portunus trituberculatus]